MGIFFYVEILCKIFPNFQTWIGFFSTFFLQNQKTRKFCTFIYLELQLSQFSVKSGTKKFFTSLHFTSLSISLPPGQLALMRATLATVHHSVIGDQPKNQPSQKGRSPSTSPIFSLTSTGLRRSRARRYWGLNTQVVNSACQCLTQCPLSGTYRGASSCKEWFTAH